MIENLINCKKIKVLILQNQLSHYNVPIFDSIGAEKGISLFIGYFQKDKECKIGLNFYEINLKKIKIGPFIFSSNKLTVICNEFDVVIALADLHYISFMKLAFIKNKKFKLIYWGIGVSSSYKNKFDQKRRWDFLRFLIMKKADALIFYSDYPIEKYIKNGFKKEKLFVAPNTIEVTKTFIHNNIEKKNILFVGKLYKEKGIYDLLYAYKESYIINSEIPNLIIIGEGNEFNKIKKWIMKNKLNDKIFLLGGIYDNIELEKQYAKSIVSISPNQAGLSVLQSMGFGVPFITKFDSITGGERFNIINYKNGIIYKNEKELVNIIVDIIRNKELFYNMGMEAFKYYQECRKPRDMAKGFLNAINYVLNS